MGEDEIGQDIQPGASQTEIPAVVPGTQPTVEGPGIPPEEQKRPEAQWKFAERILVRIEGVNGEA